MLTVLLQGPHCSRAQGDEAGVKARKVEQADDNQRLPVGRLQRAPEGLGLLPQRQLDLIRITQCLLGLCAQKWLIESPEFGLMLFP